ncbi:hypothetical protein LIER_30786 [Lithospermum erythrorhizon]|uniref:Retrotransposon gag domain-containing protein n=1 Tax=Lithospermum erythrorhizon TaxID=34254 RepID=A0AAV3RNV4_LITER
MDIQRGKTESLRNYHNRYSNLILNIPTVDDKVAYMVFFKGLRYDKLKKALLVRTPLSKDALTVKVTTHIELEELKKSMEHLNDLRETILRQERPVSPRKSPVWERNSSNTNPRGERGNLYESLELRHKQKCMINNRSVYMAG